MHKIIYRVALFIALFSALLEAKFQAKAIDNCPAWNNLAHSKNISNLDLEIGKRYTVLRHHKGQYLIKLRQPFKTQRWVDDSCLQPQRYTDNSSVSNDIEKSYSLSSTTSSLLALSWSNYFCKTHPNRKECRPLYNVSKNHLVLHGLWPQPRDNVYCGISPQLKELDKRHHWRNLPQISLLPEDKILEEIYFPGYLSGLDRHEWIKHGVCYSSDPKQYFHDALTLTANVDKSMVGEYLRANIGASITINNLRKVFEKEYGKGSGKHIALVCRYGKITEIRIALRGKGDSLSTLLKNAPNLRSKCRRGIVESN